MQQTSNSLLDRPVNGPRSQTTVGGSRPTPKIQNLSQIVRAVRADLTNIKAQLESLPPMPDGKKKYFCN